MRTILLFIFAYTMLLSNSFAQKSSKDPILNDLFLDLKKGIPSSKRTKDFIYSTTSPPGEAKYCSPESVIEEIEEEEEEEEIVEEFVFEKTDKSLKVNEHCDIPGMDNNWKRNCQALYDSGDVPIKALEYTLLGKKINNSSFKTSGCFKTAAKGHKSMQGLTKKKFKEMNKDGIKNKCQFIINNLDERIKTHGGAYKCQMAMYYIDLCAEGKPKVIKDKAYVGYGTCKKKRGYLNQTNKGTTLTGFFLTHNKGFNFTKIRKDKKTGKFKEDKHYAKIRRNLKKKTGKAYIPSVALMGLQSSNNRSALDYKYLHVGAYTSAGCPSINPKNHWMISLLAERGPSVVVNYKKGMMENFDKCEEKK